MCVEKCMNISDTRDRLRSDKITLDGANVRQTKMAARLITGIEKEG